MLATVHLTCSIKGKEFTHNSYFTSFFGLYLFFYFFFFNLPTDSAGILVLDILTSEYVVSSGVEEVVSAQQ